MRLSEVLIQAIGHFWDGGFQFYILQSKCL